MTESQVTERDVRSLAGKLEAFAETLEPRERTVLAALIQLATAPAEGRDEPAVEGHMLDPYTAMLLAKARHEELLAEAERERRIAQARAGQPAGESPWDRLLHSLRQAREGAPPPRSRPATESPAGP
jgi:hypothetical protein